MRRTARVVAALLVASWPAVPASAQDGCATPRSLTVTTRPMPHVAAGLRPGGHLDVLALGSASLLGAHGGAADSVPDRMVQALHATVPQAAIRLTLHASRTESAEEMLAALRRELAVRRYELILWQTGTVEALRRVPPEQFRRTLAEGITAAMEAGADVVLIDMQFSRLLDRHADLAPYRAAMTEAALQPGVMMFPRYALTRAWAEDGQLDLEATARPDRRRAALRLRACLGEALARSLSQAAQASGGS
jgi:acyl-CoA thioesterase-1